MKKNTIYTESPDTVALSEPLEISVKWIGNRYSALLIRDGKIIDRMACELKEDIGCICREMLRWYDKTGMQPFSPWAEKARYRHMWNPKGKTWQEDRCFSGYTPRQNLLVC